MNAMQRGVGPAARDYQPFEPATDLVNEESSDTFLVYLPGFRKEQLKVQLTKTKELVISGERPVGDNIWRRFEKKIPVSPKYDISKITAKFENLTLYITIPKLTKTPETKADQETPASTEAPSAEKQEQEKPTSTEEEISQKPVDEQKPQNNDTENLPKMAQETEENTRPKNVRKQTVRDEQTDDTAEGEAMKRDGDKKHENNSGNFARQMDEDASRDIRSATKLQMTAEVLNVILGVLLILALGLYVKSSISNWSKDGE